MQIEGKKAGEAFLREPVRDQNGQGFYLGRFTNSTL